VNLATIINLSLNVLKQDSDKGSMRKSTTLEVFLEDVENELTYAKQDHSTK